MDKEPNPDIPEPEAKSSGFSAFWQELRRRHVVRVAMVYLVVGWLVIQVANATFEEFGIPAWAYRFVVLMVALGFPISVIVAWAFELTPEGIKTTKTARVEHPESQKDLSHSKKRHWFSLALAAAVPAVIFGALAIYFYATRSALPESELVSTEEIEDIEKSIAVLPLENMSPDPDNAFFADGVQEDILTNLSRIDELRVISRTSTLGYRGTDKNSKEIAKELGIRYLVDGSVRRFGNQVLVTVKLIDAEVDEHLWAQNFNNSLDNIFAIQASIAKEIAGQLHAILSPEAIELIERRPTENLKAYENFTKARQLILERGIERGESIALLENAVALDPDFAEAWAFLAWRGVSAWVTSYERNNPALLEKAHRAMETAVRLDPGIPHVPHAQSNFAMIEHDDYEASIKFLLKALEIDPNFSFSRRALGSRYSDLGRLAEAQLQNEAALRLDPLSNFLITSLLRVYTNRGMLDKAQALIDKNLERTRGDPLWRRFLAWNNYLESGNKNEWFSAAIQRIPEYWNNPYYRALYRLNQSDLETAIENFEEADLENWPPHQFNRSLATSQTKELSVALVWFRIGDQNNWIAQTEKARTVTEARIEANPRVSPFYYSNLVLCHALEGNREAMEPSIAKTRETSGTPFNKFRYQFGCEMDIATAYLILGENDKAIETLENASRMESAYHFSRILNLWSIFDRLRGDPRFDALLEG